MSLHSTGWREVSRAAPVFAALGDKTRLALLARLSSEGPLSITRLTAGSAVTRQAITKHLAVLATAGETAAALTATLGLAAASWVVAVRQMNGMDMGVATQLGSFAFFVALWVAMMAAMMLPGAAPAVLSRTHASGRVRAVLLFVGSYLAV